MTQVFGWLRRWAWLRLERSAPDTGKPAYEEGIGCMGIDPRDLPAQLSRIASRSKSRGPEFVMSPMAREALGRAINPSKLHGDARLTVPRSYGVYDVGGAAKRFHFGNHPVRQSELIREYPSCHLIATFLVRDDAEQLQRLLNADNAGMDCPSQTTRSQS